MSYLDSILAQAENNRVALSKRLEELAVLDGEKYNIIKEKVDSLLDSGKGYFVMMLSRVTDTRIHISREFVQHPENREDLENFGVMLTESRFAYTTTRYGDAYEYTWFLVCRPLNVVDRRGHDVFESVNGHKFVVIETPGDAAYFGSTSITVPEA